MRAVKGKALRVLKTGFEEKKTDCFAVQLSGKIEEIPRNENVLEPGINFYTFWTNLTGV